MGDLTKNISKNEVKCKCGNCDVTIHKDEEILELVQECCNHYAREEGVEKVVLIITSAARCYEYNRKPINEGGPGSNDNSQHPRARAIDFKIMVRGQQIPPRRIYDRLCTKYQVKFGLGLYNSFVHLDSRRSRARWGS